MKLPQTFYQQPTLKLSRALLGKFLVRSTGRTRIVGQIIETEAYVGPHDLASHASRGRTKRTELMFGPGGFWYIYLIYGMYWCLNIVTGKKDYPAAILIRAVKPISGLLPKIQIDGPGKLCRAFKINGRLNGTPAFGRTAKIWLEDRGFKIKPRQIKKSPRIGVDYAGAYKDKLWRFNLELKTGRDYHSKCTS